jgi:hypothetical protein
MPKEELSLLSRLIHSMLFLTVSLQGTTVGFAKLTVIYMLWSVISLPMRASSSFGLASILRMGISKI